MKPAVRPYSVHPGRSGGPRYYCGPLCGGWRRAHAPGHGHRRPWLSRLGRRILATGLHAVANRLES